jgi:hypothetical protein
VCFGKWLCLVLCALLESVCECVCKSVCVFVCCVRERKVFDDDDGEMAVACIKLVL